MLYYTSNLKINRSSKQQKQYEIPLNRQIPQLYNQTAPPMMIIQHKNKQKQVRPVEQKMKIHERVIKRSDVKLNDILINGVQLPGHRKLNGDRGKRQRKHYTYKSFYQSDGKQTEQETSGLFKNTAIRTRLKSLDIEINTAYQPETHSCQKETPRNLDLFIKTSSFMYHKPKNERYSSTQTAWNWTNRSFKVQQHNIEESVRCHSTKNRTQNPLWISHNHFNDLHLKDGRRNENNGSRLNNPKGFNDSLRAQRQEYMDLRKSVGSREAPSLLSTPKHSTDRSPNHNFTFKQSPSSIKPRSKVCYSIKQKKEQNMQTTAPPHIHIQNRKTVLLYFEEQQLINDN